jgi:hypothetical protein
MLLEFPVRTVVQRMLPVCTSTQHHLDWILWRLQD